jgi:anti-sigma regulatory factor (Ser/Thr protein kinase)
MVPSAVEVQPGRFDHPALLYQHRAEYLAATLAFVRTARAAGQPTLVAVPPANLELIRSAVGRDPGVTFADMTVAGRNPGRILPMVLLDFAGRHPGQRVAIIGEPVWAGRTEVEYPACVQHEALINTAFAGRDAAILCPYDTLRLPSRAVSDAYRTHPVMQQGAQRWASATYADPRRLAAEFNVPPTPAPADAAVLGLTTMADLGRLRRLVASRAARAELPDRRAAELVVAVNELATNSLKHSGGPGQLRVWSEETALVCEVEDGGHLSDVMAGRIPPEPDQPHGRGLVMVNAMCDLVRIASQPGRTIVRVHMRLDRPDPTDRPQWPARNGDFGRRDPRP